MGCDIHCYVEVRGSDGKWQFTDDGYFARRPDYGANDIGTLKA